MTMATKKLHFETLQLHVGQEPTGSGNRRTCGTHLSKQLPMYSITHNMRQTVSAYVMRGIFTDV